jgi:hypothetical protein
MMKFMKTKFAVVAVVAAVLGPVAAADRGAIVFRATANPEFVGPSASCPTFSVEEQIEAPNGAPAGSVEFCFATFSEGAPGHVDATGSVTFKLAGGTIDATLHLVEIPTSDSGIVQFDSGVVTGGTGAYLGASGAWHATGPITFDGEANYPNLHFAISLR